METISAYLTLSTAAILLLKVNNKTKE
jgi:hypothetical protein